MKLIDADALRAALEAKCGIFSPTARLVSIGAALNILDAQPLITCKGCKWDDGCEIPLIAPEPWAGEIGSDIPDFGCAHREEG
jgi:hypothetical protein